MVRVCARSVGVSTGSDPRPDAVSAPFTVERIRPSSSFRLRLLVTTAALSTASEGGVGWRSAVSCESSASQKPAGWLRRIETAPCTAATPLAVRRSVARV